MGKVEANVWDELCRGVMELAANLGIHRNRPGSPNARLGRVTFY
jgi:hypothetical protein